MKDNHANTIYEGLLEIANAINDLAQALREIAPTPDDEPERARPAISIVDTNELEN